MQGGAQDFSASIFAEGAISSVKITGDMVGDAGDHSASVEAHGLLGSLVLNGNASGGAGTASASVSSLDTSDFTLSGNIGSITAGNFVGGTGVNSGQIRADGTITSIHLGTLEKSVASGAGSLLSGMGSVGDGSVGSVTIANLNSTIAIGGRLGALTAESITGSTIHVADDLGALTVHGDVADSTFTARGQAVQGASKDLAFGKIAISKGVSNSNFLAGYDLNGLAVNGDAQIGAVTVGKDWVASNLVAGVQAGDDTIFGTADDSRHWRWFTRHRFEDCERRHWRRSQRYDGDRRRFRLRRRSDRIVPGRQDAGGSDERRGRPRDHRRCGSPGSRDGVIRVKKNARRPGLSARAPCSP